MRKGCDRGPETFEGSGRKVRQPCLSLTCCPQDKIPQQRAVSQALALPTVVGPVHKNRTVALHRMYHTVWCSSLPQVWSYEFLCLLRVVIVTSFLTPALTKASQTIRRCSVRRM